MGGSTTVLLILALLIVLQQDLELTYKIYLSIFLGIVLVANAFYFTKRSISRSPSTIRICSALV